MTDTANSVLTRPAQARHTSHNQLVHSLPHIIAKPSPPRLTNTQLEWNIRRKATLANLANRGYKYPTDIIPPLVMPIPGNPITAMQILDLTAWEFGITRDELRQLNGEGGRAKAYVVIRSIGMYLCREYLTGYYCGNTQYKRNSWAAVGRIFRRDHTTVISAWRRAPMRMAKLPWLAERCEAVRRRIEGAV